MSSANQRAFSAVGLAAALAWGLAGSPVLAATAAAAKAQPAPAAQKAQLPQQWSVWGGTVGVRWNRELVADLGFALSAPVGRQGAMTWDQHELFALQQAGSLDFEVRNGNLRNFVGGSVQARGGYVLEGKGVRVDLNDFRLVPRAGTATILDVIGADGKAWFYVDRLMYELIDNNTRLAVRTMDIRITPELAARLGQPEVSDWVLGEMSMTTDVQRTGVGGQVQAASTKWHGLPVPGVPGAFYQADLFMTDFTVQYMRCNGCTGAGGPGLAVFAPSSTLRNNVNNGSLQPTVAGDPLGTSAALYAADIPWYQKFSTPQPPYGNDQHPFLIWNLYRFNADGTIDQIGRSGVKHAFLTLNTGCIENPGDSHILGRGCSDVYSASNNDSNTAQGPRKEIVPATNQWGRCGSVYDTNCDGVQETPPYGAYDQRLVVTESQFSGAAQTGATYMFESWYLAREDINIYNSMGTKPATFTRSGSVWALGGQTPYKLGPAIDRWVDPAAPTATQRSTALATAEGNVKVAVKVKDLGNGSWRYDYAVMNLDFARAVTTGAEPNLRVIQAAGFDTFSVPVGSATITDVSFSDGDLSTSNDWAPAIVNGRVTWGPLTRGNTLDWGTMFRFSFTANSPPADASAALHVVAEVTRKTVPVTGLLGPATAAPKAAAR
jgi:hypothetical protein